MKTFRMGGVHPAENKLSAGSPIREAALPKQAKTEQAAARYWEEIKK